MNKKLEGKKEEKKGKRVTIKELSFFPCPLPETKIADGMINKAIEEGRESLRVLVLNKDGSLIEFLKNVLTKENHEVELASSKEEAIKKIKGTFYDVIIADLSQDDKEGKDVLRITKEIRPSTDFIIISSHESLPSAIECLKMGASDYLIKPIDPELLKVILRRTIERRKLDMKVKKAEFFKALSQIDGLTGLYNHRTFHQILNEELARAKRYKSELSILMIDVDDFKIYNDTNGHPLGDLSLKEIAWILKYTCRETDKVARYGGEEFVIILPETGKSGAYAVAERIRRAVEEIEFEREEVLPKGKLTVSIGIASFPEDAKTKKELIEKADKALYEAKKRGKNQVVFFN